MTNIDQTLISTALRLVDVATPIAKKYFRQPIPIDDKADDSPVTIADREIEHAMRTVLREACPNDAIVGEEFPHENLGASRTWVLDPIDGTRSFITGKPCFGTLIALLQDGIPVLGIIAQPITGEIWLGAQGQPSTLNEQNIATRRGRSLPEAYMYTTGPEIFTDGAETDAFARLSQQVKYTRYGGDCYAYGLLAGGYIDLVCEAGLKLYDYAALIPVITGAGGVIADWSGNPPNIGAAIDDISRSQQILAAGTPDLFREASQVLLSP
jgi:histidinol phosphatase-like enzyme (inositol monophosphatase family)